MSKRIATVVSFFVMFALVFFLAGWLLMPYLGPIPNRPVSAFEFEYWKTNWAGVFLGLVAGILSARAAMKMRERDE